MSEPAITFEPTDVFVEVNGVSTRLWRGKTTAGLRVYGLIATVFVDEGESADAFQREFASLLERRQPVGAIVLRELVDGLQESFPR